MSEDLKYLHFNNDQANRKLSKKQARANRSRTLAVLSLSPDEVKEHAANFSSLEIDTQYSIELSVGVAQTSLDDNYSRKIGRELSSSNLKTVELEVIGASINKEHIFLFFAEYEGVKLAVRVNRRTGFSTVVGKMNEPANKAK